MLVFNVLRHRAGKSPECPAVAEINKGARQKPHKQGSPWHRITAAGRLGRISRQNRELLLGNSAVLSRIVAKHEEPSKNPKTAGNTQDNEGSAPAGENHETDDQRRTQRTTHTGDTMRNTLGQSAIIRPRPTGHRRC